MNTRFGTSQNVFALKDGGHGGVLHHSHAVETEHLSHGPRGGRAEAEGTEATGRQKRCIDTRARDGRRRCCACGTRQGGNRRGRGDEWGAGTASGALRVRICRRNGAGALLTLLLLLLRAALLLLLLLLLLLWAALLLLLQGHLGGELPKTGNGS
jgi:hypothetical protein